MMVDVKKERNHYFDLLKYLLFILVVLIHNPLPENLGGMDGNRPLCSSCLFRCFRLFQQGSRKKAT